MAEGGARMVAGRCARWVVVMGGLWLLWGPGGLRSFRQGEPEDGRFVVSAEGVAGVAEGERFFVEGWVHPMEEGGALKDGLFIYRYEEETKDYGSNRRMVVRAEARPALVFEWAGGKKRVERDGYVLKDAPRVPDRPWYRFAQRNRGFRPGDEAVLSAVKRGGDWGSVELGAGPREVLRAEIRKGNRIRWWLGLGLKTAVSLGLVSLVVPRWKGR